MESEQMAKFIIDFRTRVNQFKAKRPKNKDWYLFTSFSFVYFGLLIFDWKNQFKDHYYNAYKLCNLTRSSRSKQPLKN
jgi:hypothetical protein